MTDTFTPHRERPAVHMIPVEKFWWLQRMEAAYNNRVRFLTADAPPVSAVRRLREDDWAAAIGLRDMGDDAYVVGRLLAESVAGASR